MTQMSSYINLTEKQFSDIAASNVLRKSWHEKLGAKKIKYMDFVAKLARDPESLLQDQEQHVKDAFYQQLPEMLVPLAYENAIVLGCERLVFKLANKLGFKSDDLDDAANIGRLAVRNSIWHYTNTATAFSSYAFRSIYNRLLDYKVDVVQKDNDSPVTSISKLGEIDSVDEVYKKMKQLPAQQQETTVLLSKETGENVKIRDVMYEAAKDDIDHKLIDYYFNKGARWGQVFRAQVLNPVTNRPFSKAGIYKRFNNLVKRVKENVHERVSVYHVEG